MENIILYDINNSKDQLEKKEKSEEESNEESEEEYDDEYDDNEYYYDDIDNYIHCNNDKLSIIQNIINDNDKKHYEKIFQIKNELYLLERHIQSELMFNLSKKFVTRFNEIKNKNKKYKDDIIITSIEFLHDMSKSPCPRFYNEHRTHIDIKIKIKDIELIYIEEDLWNGKYDHDDISKCDVYFGNINIRYNSSNEFWLNNKKFLNNIKKKYVEYYDLAKEIFNLIKLFSEINKNTQYNYMEDDLV